MRLQNTIRLKTQALATGARIAALLILAVSAVPLAAQQVAMQPNAVRKQLNQPAQAKPTAPPQVPLKPKPAPAAPSSPVRPALAPAKNPATQATAKPTAASVAVTQNLAAKPAGPAEATPDAPHENVARRDPFSPLVDKDKTGTTAGPLPPGKNGLQINTVHLDGIVRGPNGSIAVVSNPQQRVYFLREGDRVYDGQVSQITADAISFHESGQDPFGKPVERDVTKRLYPSPGEQQ